MKKKKQKERRKEKMVVGLSIAGYAFVSSSGHEGIMLYVEVGSNW